MRLEKDLLDDWIIMVANGRLKSKLGQRRTLAFTCYNDAFEQFAEMVNMRYRRGYQCTAYQNDAPIFIHLLSMLAMGKPITMSPKRRLLPAQKQSISMITSLPEVHRHQQLSFGF